MPKRVVYDLGDDGVARRVISQYITCAGVAS
jgi:hypothetical protein